MSLLEEVLLAASPSNDVRYNAWMRGEKVSYPADSSAFVVGAKETLGAGYAIVRSVTRGVFLGGLAGVAWNALETAQEGPLELLFVGAAFDLTYLGLRVMSNRPPIR